VVWRHSVGEGGRTPVRRSPSSKVLSTCPESRPSEEKRPYWSNGQYPVFLRVSKLLQPVRLRDQETPVCHGSIAKCVRIDVSAFVPLQQK